MLLLGLVNSSAVTNDRLTMLNSTLILILVRSNCWKMWQIERIFLKLKFPEEFINFIITRFIESRNQQQVRDVQGNASVRITLPFKDHIEPTSYEDSSPISWKEKKSDLRLFTGKKIVDDIKAADVKPRTINKSTTRCLQIKMICAMRITLAILTDILSNALMNTNTELLKNTCVTPTDE